MGALMKIAFMMYVAAVLLFIACMLGFHSRFLLLLQLLFSNY